MDRKKKEWISAGCMYLGLALVATGVIETYRTWSPRYWPLLVIGLAVGCVSTPFYYYFKAKDRSADPYGDVAINTLSELGRQGADSAPKDVHHGA